MYLSALPCSWGRSVRPDMILDVALALVLTWDNHGQAVLAAQPVTGSAHLVIAVLVRMVVLVVGEADRIKIRWL